MKHKLSTYIVIALVAVVAVVGVFSLHKTTAVAQQAITSLVDVLSPVARDIPVQVAPIDNAFVSLSPFLSNASNMKFFVYGDSVLNDTLIAENLDIDIPESSIGYATANLNIGYPSTSVPSLARMQVDGDVKVYGLNTGNSDPYCVCADQYGVMKTCGRYDPANGLTCVTAGDTCTAPTLLSLTSPNQVVFSLNGETDATATAVQTSSDGITWDAGNYGSPISPRSIALVTGNYYRVKTVCSGTPETTSDYSNILQYTDGGLQITYVTQTNNTSGSDYTNSVQIHYTGGNGTTYIFPQRYNTATSTWVTISSSLSTATGTFTIPCGSSLLDGTNLFRLQYDGGGAVSNTYTFNYDKPNPCSCSTPTNVKIDHLGQPFSWENGNLYDDNQGLLASCPPVWPLETGRYIASSNSTTGDTGSTYYCDNLNTADLSSEVYARSDGYWQSYYLEPYSDGINDKYIITSTVPNIGPLYGEGTPECTYW